jgi:hypothetical protein
VLTRRLSAVPAALAVVHQNHDYHTDDHAEGKGGHQERPKPPIELLASIAAGAEGRRPPWTPALARFAQRAFAYSALVLAGDSVRRRRDDIAAAINSMSMPKAGSTAIGRSAFGAMVVFGKVPTLYVALMVSCCVSTSGATQVPCLRGISPCGRGGDRDRPSGGDALEPVGALLATPGTADQFRTVRHASSSVRNSGRNSRAPLKLSGNPLPKYPPGAMRVAGPQAATPVRGHP